VSELIISIAYICFLIKVYKNKELEIIDTESEHDSSKYEHFNVDDYQPDKDAFTPSQK
jgi:hypothetical protein